MERLLTSLFQETGGLGIQEDLLLFVTNMQMRLKRQLRGWMEGMLMDGILLCSLQNMVQMQK